jgi:lysophospholipase L1-like esterase
MPTLRRDNTSAGFISGNPVLAAGEHGYETDTEASKIGDGVTAWADLPYSGANPTFAALNATYATQAKQANVTRRLGALLNNPPVANRGLWPMTLSNGTDTAENSWSRHILTSDVTEVRLVYVNANTPAGVEAGPGNPITVTSSIELADGSILPVPFRGLRAVVIESGGFAVSDPVTLDLPKGTAIRSRTYVTVTSGKWPRGWNGSYVGTLGDSAEVGASGTITDKTLTGSVGSASSTAMYGPSAIIGKGSTVYDVPSIGLVGDSIMWGQGSEGNTRVSQAGSGFGAVALNNNFNFVNVGDPGDRATITSVRANHSLRWLMLQGCTHVISNFGVNDLSNGVTLADWQASAISIWTQLVARGAKVWQTTITPVTTSTDGWLTAANQTAGSFGAINPANLWLRDGAPMLAGVAVATGSSAGGTLRAGAGGHPLTGVFDTALTVTTVDGKWKDALSVVSRTGLSGTSGGTTLTAATSQFTIPTDRYKRIIIPGAGAAGGLYVGQIAAYTSGTSVTVSPAFGTTVSGVTGTVFDPMTNDGVHPFNPAADLMAAAINTSLLTL